LTIELMRDDPFDPQLQLSVADTGIGMDVTVHALGRE
jgi:hypothetical protein